MALLYDGVEVLKDRVIRVGASSCWQSGKPVSRCAGKSEVKIEIEVFHREAAEGVCRLTVCPPDVFR
jgi:hypothetical protein